MNLLFNNTRYTGQCTMHFYAVGAYNHNQSLGSNNTLAGVATLKVPYNSNGAYAYKAVAKLTGGTIQVMSSPVQLTAGTSTTLLLNVTRDFDSTRHVFTCRLLGNGLPVSNRMITLKLNSTAYTNTTVNGVAEFMFHLSPQADNNQTVFNVVASFRGDNVSTATATMNNINSTTYAVGTTTQYNGYELFSDSASARSSEPSFSIEKTRA